MASNVKSRKNITNNTEIVPCTFYTGRDTFLTTKSNRTCSAWKKTNGALSTPLGIVFIYITLRKINCPFFQGQFNNHNCYALFNTLNNIVQITPLLIESFMNKRHYTCAKSLDIQTVGCGYYSHSRVFQFLKVF